MSTPKVITLSYELRSGSPEGEVIEIADKENPAEFLFGVGNLINEFEDQIVPLGVGETFDFLINSENAYGPSDPSAVVDLPRNIFVVDGKEAEDLLVVGKTIPMRDQNGQPLQGVVVEILDDKVKMDFNHPLAGHDLHFKGEVIETRDASPEEVDHKHVHNGNDGH
jgi:FKBP-type peptidyl-prolyl cis-trans isomerase SlyD